MQPLRIFPPVSPVSEEVGVVDVELRLEPADGAVHQRVVRQPAAVWRSGGATGTNSNKMSVKKGGKILLKETEWYELATESVQKLVPVFCRHLGYLMGLGLETPSVAASRASLRLSSLDTDPTAPE